MVKSWIATLFRWGEGLQQQYSLLRLGISSKEKVKLPQHTKGLYEDSFHMDSITMLTCKWKMPYPHVSLSLIIDSFCQVFHPLFATRLYLQVYLLKWPSTQMNFIYYMVPSVVVLVLILLWWVWSNLMQCQIHMHIYVRVKNMFRETFFLKPIEIY